MNQALSLYHRLLPLVTMVKTIVMIAEQPQRPAAAADRTDSSAIPLVNDLLQTPILSHLAGRSAWI